MARTTEHYYAYFILALCSLLQAIVSGNTMNYSVFFNAWSQTLQANNKQLMLIFALHTAAVGVASPTVAPIAERLGNRLTILLGLALLAAGYAGAAMLTVSNVWPLLFWLGFVVGVGASLVTVASANLSGAFLSEQRRLWSVMLTVSHTVGAALRLPLLRALLDWFGPFQALLVWAGVLLLCLVLLPFLPREAKSDKNATVRTRQEERFFTLPLVTFLLGTVLMTSVIAARELSPKYAESELGMTGQWSAWAASIGFLASFAALLLLLVATRFVHTDGVMLSALLVCAASLLAMAWTSDEALFIALLSLSGAGYSVARALLPAALAERVQQVPRAYGVVYSTIALGAACWGVLSGVVIDASGTIRAFYLLSALLLVGAFGAFVMSRLCINCRRKGASESQVPLEMR